jgi:hypothetical protein
MAPPRGLEGGAGKMKINKGSEDRWEMEGGAGG